MSIQRNHLTIKTMKETLPFHWPVFLILCSVFSSSTQPNNTLYQKKKKKSDIMFLYVNTEHLDKFLPF